jgi:diphosphomevalonate decarboxylase
MMTKAEIVAQILNGRGRAPAAGGYAFAPSNIALCKYWGKRDEELNLPVTASLSISLGRLGSTTKLSLRPDSDVVRLDKKELAPDSPFARRIGAFLDLFRRDAGMYFEVEAVNTIPTAAGFASSASGFAALVTALDELFGWELDKRELSILARLGSGSACRSLHHGFVEWRAGTRPGRHGQLRRAAGRSLARTAAGAAGHHRRGKKYGVAPRHEAHDRDLRVVQILAGKGGRRPGAA